MSRCISDDLIKRSDAIKAYNEAMSELVKWQMEEWQLGHFSECEFNTTDCKHIVRKIEAIPSADRPQGKWRKHDKERDYCSVCKHIFKTRTLTNQDKWTTYVDDLGYNFCPNCGADMRGDSNEQMD